MGLSVLGTAIALALLGDGPVASFCAKLFYPLGFITVILGRVQLFTENTLYPVALVLARKKHVLSTLRLWSLVLPENVLGAAAAHSGCSRQTRRGGVTASTIYHGLEWRDGRLDDCKCCMAGIRIALDHRLCNGDLYFEICCGLRRLCSLYRRQR